MSHQCNLFLGLLATFAFGTSSFSISKHSQAQIFRPNNRISQPQIQSAQPNCECLENHVPTGSFFPTLPGYAPVPFQVVSPIYPGPPYRELSPSSYFVTPIAPVPDRNLIEGLSSQKNTPPNSESVSDSKASTANKVAQAAFVEIIPKTQTDSQPGTIQSALLLFAKPEPFPPTAEPPAPDEPTAVKSTTTPGQSIQQNRNNQVSRH